MASGWSSFMPIFYQRTLIQFLPHDMIKPIIKISVGGYHSSETFDKSEIITLV